MSILARLMGRIEDRKRNRPVGSYTVTLLDGGVDRIGAKIHEEAAEVVAAAQSQHTGMREEVIHEAADLIYHLFVLMAHCGVTLDAVEAELARRYKPG
jgi:phosphoribosyl-ATP pyrophosphohydrolase